MVDSQYVGCAPDGRWVFRTKIFGGISAEVTTMFNGSNIVDIAKGRPPFPSITLFIFSLPILQHMA